MPTFDALEEMKNKKTVPGVSAVKVKAETKQTQKKGIDGVREGSFLGGSDI